MAYDDYFSRSPLADVFAGRGGARRSPQIDPSTFAPLFAQAIARAGRGRDTELAHITPEEGRYLEEKYDGGSVNPVTGLKEYAGEPGAGRGGEGSTGGGGVGGSGGGGDSGGGGFGGDDRGTGRGGGGPAGGTSEAAAAQGRGSKGESSAQGRASRGEVRGGSASMSGPGRGGSGVGAQDRAGATAAANAKSRRDFERALSMAMNVAFGNPLSLATSVIDPEDEDTGLTGTIGTVRDIAETVGKGISAFGGASAGTVGSANPNAAGVTGVPGPADVSGGPGDFVPGERPLPDLGLRRPDALTPPMFLGIQNAMTPIQQRSRIATFGTGGESGGFRSDPAQEYFKNIFLRSVLGDENQLDAAQTPFGAPVRPGAQILPVEAQYAQQVLGLDVTPEMGVEDFARTLAGLPSRGQVAEFLAAVEAARPLPRVQEGPG